MPSIQIGHGPIVPGETDAFACATSPAHFQTTDVTSRLGLQSPAPS